MSSKKSKNRKGRRSAQAGASSSSTSDASGGQRTHLAPPAETASTEPRPAESGAVAAAPLITGKITPVEQAPIDRVASTGEAPASSPKRPVQPTTNTLLVAPKLVASQILANIEANQRTTLQAAGALMDARSLPEILALQLRFWIEQCAALGVQSTELIELIGKIYATPLAPPQPSSSPESQP